ncbi:MAG: hypothetical protein QNJ41_19855 [Xenococcaceae cyanobacterium MO_188.B32]|nr:hypothetical protein [Xenococcaceae cyanobacterium MO_188.B32]
MKTSKYPLQGWNIVGWTTLTIAIIFLCILIVHGINEQSMRIAIRTTARTSCLLFVCAFVASPLRYFWSNNITKWLRVNRRYLGVAMAVSHGFHAIAIIGLAILTADSSLNNNHGGNLGYFFIIAMTATSFPSTAALLGNQNWKILHTVGMYYLWLAFIYTFSHGLEKSLFIYLPFVSLLAVAFLLRLITPLSKLKIKRG